MGKDVHSAGTTDTVFSWEEDRKIILRVWSLIFSILATLMVFIVLDGRMAYLEGSYTGYLGFSTDCRKHMCASLDQVTVLIHMGQGFMMLALGLCVTLVSCMVISFWSVFRRLSKSDLVFSFISISVGLLILLSLMLFVVNCMMLEPKPQISYLVTFYLCLCASALMLWAGALSYLNQVGIWSTGKSATTWRISYRRWTLEQCTSLRLFQQQTSEKNLELTLDTPSPNTPQDRAQTPPRNDTQDTSW